MSPKTTKNNSEISEEGKNIIVLCHMMMSSDSFEANSSKLAPVLGISHPKNVPRKINSIIGPYGFEFKNNKLIKKDGNSPAATPTTPSRDGQGDPATPSSKKLEKKATPASKKRKVNEAVVDENDAADEENDNA